MHIGKNHNYEPNHPYFFHYTYCLKTAFYGAWNIKVMRSFYLIRIIDFLLPEVVLEIPLFLVERKQIYQYFSHQSMYIPSAALPFSNSMILLSLQCIGSIVEKNVTINLLILSLFWKSLVKLCKISFSLDRMVIICMMKTGNKTEIHQAYWWNLSAPDVLPHDDEWLCKRQLKEHHEYHYEYIRICT